jgi:hypothetical protein
LPAAAHLSISHRGANQIELRSSRQLDLDRPACHRTEVYYFIPRGLDITPLTYPGKLFFRDTSSHYQLRPARLDLVGLNDAATSPLRRLLDAVAEASAAERSSPAGDDEGNDEVAAACRSLVATTDLLLIEHRGALEASRAGGDRERAVALARQLADESARLVASFRNALSLLDQTRLDPAAAAMDEALSLLVEDAATIAATVLDEVAPDTGDAELSMARRAVLDRAAAEVDHRRSRGYGTILDPDDDNEEYLSRSATVLRYARGALVLDAEPRPGGRLLEQVADALAAGLAMAFATAVAFEGQRRFGNFTLPLFMALIAGYMGKDRIKELSRHAIASQVRKRTSDRCVILRSPDGKRRLAVVKEKVRVVAPTEVPAEVLAARQQAGPDDLAIDDPGETVLYHAIEISERSRRRYRDGDADEWWLTGVLRFDLHRLVSKMAQPVQHRRAVDGGAVVQVECRKVYHLNLISLTDGPDGQPLRHSRVVMDQDGIRRIEDPADGPSAGPSRAVRSSGNRR